jgi:hypothetical protein
MIPLAVRCDVISYVLMFEFLKLIISGGFCGTIVVIVGKYFFERKLESLKSELGKENAIHKLRFEKEFELYGKFWKALMDVRNSASVTPMLDIMPKGSEPLDVYKERWLKAANMLNEAIRLLYGHLPFYHDDVSKPAKKLLDKCWKHLTNLQITLQDGRIGGGSLNMYKEDRELSTVIYEAVDAIEIVIKKRIGLLQEEESAE